MSRRTQARDTFSRDGRVGIDHARDLPEDANASHQGRDILAAIQQVVVERLNGRPASMGELLAGRVLLVLIDDRAGARHRSSAEIAWVEERLDPDVRLVLVWRKRPVTLRRLSPTRAATLCVIDGGGELRRLVEQAGSRKAVLVDIEAGTVEPANRHNGVGQRPGSREYWKGNALSNASSHLLCRILFG